MLEFINHKDIERKYPNAAKQYTDYWKSTLSIRKASHEAIIITKFNYNADDIRRFFDSIGLYMEISLEFYLEGINFNYQIWWYIDKDEIEKNFIELGNKITKHDFLDGTGMYGDCNEYPTREKCLEYAIQRCFYLLENKLIFGNYHSEFDKDPYKFLQNRDEYEEKIQQLPEEPFK